MITIIGITLKGIFRDRVFQGIMVIACAFLLIPGIASLSMRQITELSLTLSLSLISFILLLLSVFWAVRRSGRILNVVIPLVCLDYRFLGRVIFWGVSVALPCLYCWQQRYLVLLHALWLRTLLTFIAIRPIVWSTIFLCILFDALKYILLIAVAFLFSTVSTSFFLPVFGTIATFLAGGVTQQVYEYIQFAASYNLSPVVRQLATGLYYLLPNFGAFDLKVNAIYSLPVPVAGQLLTLAYFVVYAGIMLSLSSLIFMRREMR